MQQLLLDIYTETQPSLHSFVEGRNAELMRQLFHLVETGKIETGESSLFLWGDAGTGKSHLLQALAQYDKVIYLSPQSPKKDFIFNDKFAIYALDDCDKLSDAQQILAFALYNDIKENNAVLVGAAKSPPRLLAVREDLRTRFGWGLIYQIMNLMDEEKIEALAVATQNQGMHVPLPVIVYLINHHDRDMRSLSRIIAQLDYFSRETQRAITMPLLREWLQQNPQD